MGGELNVQVIDPLIGDNELLKTDPHSGILLRPELNGDLTINTVLNAEELDTVENIQLGGAEPEQFSYWKNMSIAQVLGRILFPLQLPHYILPTITLIGPSVADLVEVGTLIAYDFTMTGVENDAGVITMMQILRNGSVIGSSTPTGLPIADIPPEYHFNNPNNPNNQYEYVYSESFAVLHGLNTWRGLIAFNAGLAKYENKGSLDVRTPALLNVNAPQIGGVRLSDEFVVHAEYPIFWGTSAMPITPSAIQAAIDAGTANRALVSAENDISIDYEAAEEYIWFAYWDGYNPKTKWGIGTADTADIGGSTNLFGDYSLINPTSPLGLWAGPDFKVYISNYPTSTFGTMVLRNT